MHDPANLDLIVNVLLGLVALALVLVLLVGPAMIGFRRADREIKAFREKATSDPRAVHLGMAEAEFPQAPRPSGVKGDTRLDKSRGIKGGDK